LETKGDGRIFPSRDEEPAAPQHATPVGAQKSIPEGGGIKRV
jgi:hypothetical protein